MELVLILCICSMVSAFLTTHLQNPIYSVLCLISTFVFCALLLFSLGLDFFALIYIIIYVGAVAILFLFVLMTLDLKCPSLFVNVRYHFLFSGALGLFFIFPLWFSLEADLSTAALGRGTLVSWLNLCLTSSTLKVLGGVLYTKYALCFLVAGLILFVAMVGAILLTAVTETVAGTRPRHQDIYAQVQRVPQNAVFLVNRIPMSLLILCCFFI